MTEHNAMAEQIRAAIAEQRERWDFKPGQIVLAEVECKNQEGENCYRVWRRAMYLYPSTPEGCHIVKIWRGIHHYEVFCRAGEVQPIPKMKARTVIPLALLDYATGLLERHAEKQADWDHYLATLGKSERAWDEACTDEPVHYLQREIAALHAALVAQGLIGGKG